MLFRHAASRALSLDLSRLERVARRLGGAPSGGVGTRERLRQLNRAFGERLAAGGADGRPILAQAMIDADAWLPAAITTPSHLPDADAVDRLRHAGCLDLGQRLPAAQAAEVERHLRTKPLVLGHLPRQSDGPLASLDDVPRDRNFARYDYLDLWSSPHLVEFATDDALLDLVQGYLGATPTLCAFNAYWAVPERAVYAGVQDFHRELDDGRSLAVFTLLTPVEIAEEGAHCYVETSHDPARLEAGLRAEGVGTRREYLLAGPFVAAMTMRLFGRSARRFHGPAGTSFCADSFGLHRSIVPRSRPKLLLELRFGTFFNEIVHDLRMSDDSDRTRAVRRVLAPLPGTGSLFDQNRRRQVRDILRRIPATPRHRYVFRYMIDALAGER